MVIKTYNPIINVDKIKHSFFERLPIPGEGRAILLSSTIANLGIVCITRNTNIRMSDLNLKKYDYQIDIDLSMNEICFKNEVLSQDNVSKFSIMVSAYARVVDPKTVYQEQIRDVCQWAERYLMDMIRERAACFLMEQSTILSQELKRCTEHMNSLEYGIELKDICFDVQVDKIYKEHIEKIKQLDYTTDLERNKALASKIIQDLYSDLDVAAFSDVAMGKIGASEAIQQIKAGRSQDFDEKMRQFSSVMKVLDDLGDTLDDAQKEQVAKGFLSTMVPSVSNLAIEQGKQVSGILEDRGVGTDNRYRPFDADEE